MKQFLTNNLEAFCELEERARLACIRYRGQKMPPGCNPKHADIGFEISGDPPATKLIVEKGIQYTGANPNIGEWFRTGEIQFPDFNSLQAWLLGPLKQAFSMEKIEEQADESQQKVGVSAVELTDIETVHKGIRNIHKPLYLDEDELFQRLNRRVFGQDDALKALSALMVRHLARRQPTRPAVLFSIGPSGVGKTRTAEMMSQVLKEFDDVNCGYQFLRLDMTEYQEAYRVSQLLGAPQGYKGYGDGSQLVDSLRSNPRTIVIFDEIDKAHPDILQVLTNAMDAGRLSTASSSANGRVIDCRHAVFMFTSNRDAKAILDELEDRSAFGNRTIEDEVCRRRLNAGGIGPDIVGRISRFIVFRSLSPETRAEIMALAIAEVGEEYGLSINYVEPSVIVDLMQKTLSSNFGARPERFLIDDLLGGAFAKAASQDLVNPVKVIGPPFECSEFV